MEDKFREGFVLGFGFGCAIMAIILGLITKYYIGC